MEGNLYFLENVSKKGPEYSYPDGLLPRKSFVGGPFTTLLKSMPPSLFIAPSYRRILASRYFGFSSIA